MEEVIKFESGIGVGASGAGEGAVGVDDVGGIEVLNVEGACIGELDVGLIEASAFLEVLLTGPPVMVGASLVPVILIATVVRSVSTPSVTVTS